MKRIFSHLLVLIMWSAINAPAVIVLLDTEVSYLFAWTFIAWIISAMIIEFAIRKWVNNVLEIEE